MSLFLCYLNIYCYQTEWEDCFLKEKKIEIVNLLVTKQSLKNVFILKVCSKAFIQINDLYLVFWKGCLYVAVVTSRVCPVYLVHILLGNPDNIEIVKRW